MNFILEHRALISLALAVASQFGKHFGVELDADGLTNDIISFIGLAVAAQHHVQVKKAAA